LFLGDGAVIGFNNNDVNITHSANALTLNGGSLTLSNGILSVDDTTDSSSTVTGSIHTDGGLGVAKKSFFGAELSINKGTADEPFFDFVATADADATSAISTLTTSGGTTHHIQIEINGTTAWIACSTTDPS